MWETVYTPSGETFGKLSVVAPPDAMPPSPKDFDKWLSMKRLELYTAWVDLVSYLTLVFAE